MYALSTDYTALYELLLKGEEVACWVDLHTSSESKSKSKKLLALTRETEWEYFHNPAKKNSVKNFCGYCAAFNLQYIPSHKVVAEKAWDAANEYAVQLSWKNQIGNEYSITAQTKEDYLKSI